MLEVLNALSFSLLNDVGNWAGFILWLVVLVDYTYNWVRDLPKQEPTTITFLTAITGHKIAASLLIVFAPLLFGLALQFTPVAIGLGVYVAVAYMVRSIVRINRRLSVIYEQYGYVDPVTQKRGGWHDE